jgi:hypothetical protein
MSAVIATVAGYEVSLAVHIAAVMIGFGATFAESLAFPVAMKMSPKYLPYVHRLQLAINRFLATPALAVVLATGIYQVIDGNWSFGDAWISASFVIIIVVGGLLGAYFIPTDRKLGPMVEAEIEAAGDGEIKLSEEYLSKSRTEGIIGAATGLLLVVAVFLMVLKPGA